jgi:hypothetical protein
MRQDARCDVINYDVHEVNRLVDSSIDDNTFIFARDIFRLPVKLPLMSFTNAPFILLAMGDSKSKLVI